MNETTPPDPILDSLQQLALRVAEYFSMFLVPGWRQNQLFIILALVAVAWLAQLVLRDRLSTWARGRSGLAKWKLRAIVQIRQRLGLACFVLLAWSTYAVMQQITWPSRSYLVGVAATLASVWLIIGFLTRLVRQPLPRKLIKWALWIYATLYALDVHDDAGEFLDGIAIGWGEVNLTLLTVLKGIVLISVLLVIARVVTQSAATNLRRNEDISPSMQVLATKAIQLLVYAIAFMVAVRSLGVDLTGLAILSGAIGVGIGFGLQKVVSNLVSGIIILLDKSIKPGDVISLGETFGWIDSLGARYVSVVTRDGKEYLIPNEDLITNQVVNWTHSDQYVRLDINFGTSYGDDPHKVRAWAIEAASSVGRVHGVPRAPVCHVIGFGDSSVDYVLRFWISDPTGGLTNIRGLVYLALWDTFTANGVSIPFPQREVRVLGEPLPESDDLPPFPPKSGSL